MDEELLFLSDAFPFHELFSELTHKWIVETSARRANVFTEEEINILVSHCMDPDNIDKGAERIFNHFYDVVSGNGAAPGVCNIYYMKSVNTHDLVTLSYASHYLMDVGCIFHTTLKGQNHHLWYEDWVDQNLAEITTNIIFQNPIDVSNVQDAVIQLATITYDRYEAMMNYILTSYYIGMINETRLDLSDTVAYLEGLFRKWKYDVDNGIVYDIPEKQNLNLMLLVFLAAVSLPLLAYFTTTKTYMTMIDNTEKSKTKAQRI